MKSLRNMTARVAVSALLLCGARETLIKSQNPI